MKADWIKQAREPIELFQEWMEEAEQEELNDPNAVALATATRECVPSVRMVLVKGVDERGFAFYTNSEGRKGRELAENPHAAMCFYWKSLRRQVRVEGTVTELPREEADAYFQSRSRGSQLGAAASAQSRMLVSRAVLEERVAELARQFPEEIPRPECWKGYVLRAERIEFWANGADRLHTRLLFLRNGEGWRDGEGWKRTLLFP